jgi:hypothetical protein
MVCLEDYSIKICGGDSYEQMLQQLENAFTYNDGMANKHIVSLIDDTQTLEVLNPVSSNYSHFDLRSQQIKKFSKSSNKELTLKRRQSFKDRVEIMIPSSNTKRKCWDYVQFKSDSKFRKILDIVQLFNLVYIALIDPLEIAFSQNPLDYMASELVSSLI